MSELKTNETSEKKVYYIPMEISKADAAAMGLDAGEVKSRYFCGHFVPCLMVPTEDARVYHAVCSMFTGEKTKEARNNRCLQLSERYHRPVRCAGDCRQCENRAINSMADAVSLEQFMDEKEFDISDNTTAEDPLMNDAFMKTLQAAVADMGKADRLIARAILEGIPDKTMEGLLGIDKHSTYSSHKMKVRKKLQKAMKEWL